MTTQVVFDLSRLLSRADRPVPTGIDRVELAYARYLVENASGNLGFAASAFGRLGPLPTRGALVFIKALEAIWVSGVASARTRLRVRALAHRLLFYAVVRGEAPLYERMAQYGGDVAYLLVSHQNLERPGIMQRLKSRTNARIVCFVHDLIPIQYPEYARAGQADRHSRRMDTVVRFADAVIVNSECTRTALNAHRHPGMREFPILVAPLGIDLESLPKPRPIAPERPYFICIGTIEPRKNHLMLLKLWRRLASQLGERAPELILVGQRGWENENAVDMMERSPGVVSLLKEHNSLPDEAMVLLLAGARALLLPSFAEGYGLPVAEALSLGVPVLCSDLPALRSIGKDVAEYLDPLDGPAWFRAILDYAAPESRARAAQLARLRSWTPPRWEEHFSAVQTLIDGKPAFAEPALLAAAL